MKTLTKVRKWTLRILKWTGLSILSVLTLIVIAGLILRIFTPKPQPPGELVDIGGVKLHIDRSGEKNNKPTVVIEGGGGMATEYYHWLNEGLKDSIRVFRYDRAGIGYSDASKTPRDAETVAHELHALLEEAGESPPYIMVGHSLGGPFVRVFTQLYPNEVVGMFLLDTTHPDRVEKVGLPSKSSWKFKIYTWSYDVQAVLGDIGIMLLFDKLMGPILPRKMEGLPEEINHSTINYLTNGKYLKTVGNEMRYFHATLNRTREASDFGSLAIRVFPATPTHDVPEEVYQEYLKRGMDLRKMRVDNLKLQQDLVHLSTNAQLIPIDGNHTSMFTVKENADIICTEILHLVDELNQGLTVQ